MLLRSALRIFAPTIAACLMVAPLQSSAALSNSGYVAVGSPAPSFSGKSLDGRTIDISEYKGRVLVLNFWATWCPPCRAETPDMITGYGALSGSKVAFLGVDTTENASVIKTFVAIKGVPYPTIVVDPTALNAYGIEGLPTTIVVDANGIVRARWVGGVSTSRLRSYVVAARAGKDANFLTPEQQKIDSMLALGQFKFSGTAAQASDAAGRAIDRMNAVDAYESKLDSANPVPYDYERSEHEEGALALQVALLSAREAKTAGMKLAAARELGTAYGAMNRFSDAANTYRAVLAKNPNNVAFTGLLAYAYYRLHDYASQAAVAQTWTKLAPDSSDAWDSLGLANERMKQFAAAAPAYENAVRLLRGVADANIGKAGVNALSVADEALDMADVYVALGDTNNAKRVFALSAKYAAMIPAKSPYNFFPARVAERTLEGMTAAGLGHSDATSVSLTKWTGADLPGSVASTLKYRLVVVAPAGKHVTLDARGLKPNWVASFCSDRLCSPNHVSFDIPATGVKTYEFQLIPPNNGAAPGKVFVAAAGEQPVAVP